MLSLFIKWREQKLGWRGGGVAREGGEGRGAREWIENGLRERAEVGG